MAKTNRRKFTNIKKSIKSFVRDEDGFVAKENILKIGLGTVSALAIMDSVLNTAHAAADSLGVCQAHQSHDENCTNILHSSVSSHDNALYRVPQGGSCYSLRHCNAEALMEHNAGDEPCGPGK